MKPAACTSKDETAKCLATNGGLFNAITFALAAGGRPKPEVAATNPPRWYIRSRRRVRASEPLIRLDRLLGRASRPTASQHVVRNLGLHANHDSDIAVGLLAGLDLD